MATLVRARADADLRAGVPAPFPVHLLDAPAPAVDIHPSVAAVEHSCLATLASVFSLSSPLGPDTGAPIPLHQALSESPLSCLVHALRARDDQPDLPLDEAALLTQLRDLVDAAVPSLSALDAHLAQTIVALLIDLEQLPASLAALPPPHATPPVAAPAPASPYDSIASLQRHLSSLRPPPTSSGSTPSPAETIRSALLWTRIDEQLDSVVALCRARASSPPRHDTSRASSSQFPDHHHRPSFDDLLPPEYDSDYHHDPYEHPPSYAFEARPSASNLSDEKHLADQHPPEKILSASLPSAESTTDPSTSSGPPDLDAITHAIERLHIVAPQLGNQRVELRREKIVQMELAKAGKRKARTLADAVDPELDKILDLVGKASAREIPDQSVVIDPRRTGREKGAVDIEEQRRKYLEHLLNRTHAGRLHSQDATPSLDRSCSSQSALAGGNVEELSCSEGQPEGCRSFDGKRASFPITSHSDSTAEPPAERPHSRSLSASHLTWLRTMGRSGNPTIPEEDMNFKSLPPSAPSSSARNFSGILRASSKSRPPSTSGEDVSCGALDIAYVAEHHDTLKHVLVFIAYASPSSSASNEVPLAEVLPSTSSGTNGDCLFLRLAGTPSPPLALPVPVVPGSKIVFNRSGHWEIKASCPQGGAPPQESEDAALLPASELTLLSPSSYACSSCSLPLVPAPPARYRDLPSEHWEELIEAWICHPEGQTLTKAGMRGIDRDGETPFVFWPTRDEALVGGSYVLFDSGAVAGGNIKCIGGQEGYGNPRPARCLCGAILGRQHDRKQVDSPVLRMYRLFKYAIRPISATSQVPKIPMGAFVLRDMLEHVRAHATYRFVLTDDEEERPRLLIWLFKPRLRISYMLPTPVLLPKSGTIDAAKVLYKILGPSSTASDFKEVVSRYPGFPQAEYLFYPMDVCRKLAAVLKESTTSYPEGMRSMTGLDVGWLAMR